jgi:hypothetical protein
MEMTLNDAEAERERLIGEMLEQDRDLDSIKAQISAAKVRLARYGQHADHDWFRRISDAQRHRRRERQEMQARLGEINRVIRKLTAKEHDKRFADIARRLLPAQTWSKIAAEAEMTA